LSDHERPNAGPDETKVRKATADLPRNKEHLIPARDQEQTSTAQSNPVDVQEE